MKPKNYLAITLMAIFVCTVSPFKISQSDGNGLTDTVDCQKLLKEHRNYSNPNLTPISVRYARPYFHGFSLYNHTNEPLESESLADIERKEEIKVRLTMQVFSEEIDDWRKNILTCINLLGRVCAKEPMKSKIERQELEVASRLTDYRLITHSFDKINTTQMYETIAQDKRMLAEIETTQNDLCASGDAECQDCLERNADKYYTEGETCVNFRHWHMIKYEPIRDNPCKPLSYSRAKSL